MCKAPEPARICSRGAPSLELAASVCSPASSLPMYSSACASRHCSKVYAPLLISSLASGRIRYQAFSPASRFASRASSSKSSGESSPLSSPSMSARRDASTFCSCFAITIWMWLSALLSCRVGARVPITRSVRALQADRGLLCAHRRSAWHV
jgi:hypothetical protein